MANYNSYKTNKVQDDLGYTKRDPDTNIKSLVQRSKVISPTESPLKQWWLSQSDSATTRDPKPEK
jgi:hypothetical protein